MTSWINRLLDYVCSELNWKFVQVFNPNVLDMGLADFVNANNADVLAYTDPEPEIVRSLGPLVGFHIIRDPRDIVVSAYFSHLNSHLTQNWPELLGHRAKLQTLSKDEGLLLEIEFRRDEFRQIHDWNYQQPTVLELKMEDVITNPYDAVVGAMLFIDAASESVPFKKRLLGEIRRNIRQGNTRTLFQLPFVPLPKRVLSQMPVEFLLKYVYENRFSVMAAGRERGTEDVGSHYRKGKAGDWRQHFKPQHIDYFKKHFNDVLLKTGYESTRDW